MALPRRHSPRSIGLDNMDCLTLAAQMIETELGFVSSGTGSICYRSTDDRTFPHAQNSARDVLTHYGADPKSAEIRDDDFGFSWLIAQRPQPRHSPLVADLRTACKVFADNRLGAQLLCAMVVLEGPGRTQIALVYLFKRGTVYPFAPLAPQTRDNRLELVVKNLIEGRVPVEADQTRWFPIWDAPGMSY
jgi:hypothetical protein